MSKGRGPKKRQFCLFPKRMSWQYTQCWLVGSCSPGQVSLSWCILPGPPPHPKGCQGLLFSNQKCRRHQAKPVMCFTPLLLHSAPGLTPWPGSTHRLWPVPLHGWGGWLPCEPPAPTAGDDPLGLPGRGYHPKTRCCCRPSSDERTGLSKGAGTGGEARVCRQPVLTVRALLLGCTCPHTHAARPRPLRLPRRGCIYRKGWCRPRGSSS